MPLAFDRETKMQGDEVSEERAVNATKNVPQDWPWPDSLDAVIAAPKYHKLLFENERVRLLEVRIRPGETTPVHTHRWPSAIYVAKQSDFIRRDGEGNLLFDSRTVGPPPSEPVVQWVGPLPPHSVENVGSVEILLVTTELKEG